MGLLQQAGVTSLGGSPQPSSGQKSGGLLQQAGVTSLSQATPQVQLTKGQTKLTTEQMKVVKPTQPSSIFDILKQEVIPNFKQGVKVAVEQTKIGLGTLLKGINDQMRDMTPAEISTPQGYGTYAVRKVMEKALGTSSKATTIGSIVPKKLDIYEPVTKKLISSGSQGLLKAESDFAKGEGKNLEPIDTTVGIVKLAQNPRWVVRSLAQNAPSFVSSLGLGIATGLMTKNPILATTVAFSTSATQNAGDAYAEAKQAGASDQVAEKASQIVGVINGILDTVGIGSILDSATKPVRGMIVKEILKDIAKSAASESSTEGMQQIIQNATAKVLFDKKRNLMAGVPESAFIGAIMGGGGSATVNTSQQALNKLFKPGEYTPQEVIDAVVGSELKETEDGKAVLKEAIQAQKTGDMVVVSPEAPKSTTNTQKTEAKQVGLYESAKVEQKQPEQPQLVDTKPKNSTSIIDLLKTTRDQITQEKDTNAQQQAIAEASKSVRADIVSLMDTSVGKFNEVRKEILTKSEKNGQPDLEQLSPSARKFVEEAGKALTDKGIISPNDSNPYDEIISRIAETNEVQPTKSTPKSDLELEDKIKSILSGDEKQAQKLLDEMQSELGGAAYSSFSEKNRKSVGTAKEKTPKLSLGIEQNAIEKKLISKLGDEPLKSSRTTWKEQAKLASELSPDELIKVALGQESPKGDLLANAAFVAAEEYAIEKGDIFLIQQLKNSPLAEASTRAGQEIGVLSQRDTNSPVATIQELEKSRAESKKKKGVTKETKQTEVKKIKAEKPKVDKNNWNAFIDSIKC